MIGRKLMLFFSLCVTFLNSRVGQIVSIEESHRDIPQGCTVPLRRMGKLLQRRRRESSPTLAGVPHSYFGFSLGMFRYFVAGDCCNRKKK